MTPEEIEKLPYRPNVGIMLVNSNGKIFVAQRLDSPGPAWQMPQGGIDKDEEPKVAALRELEEETGVSPKFVVAIANTKGWLQYDFPHEIIPNIARGKYRGQKQIWFLMQFLGQDHQINIKTKQPEFSSWRWGEPSELVENIVPFKKEIYTQVLTEFEEYL